MSPLKIKIKLPKLLARPKNLLSKHISSFFSYAFSSKMSQEMSPNSQSMKENLEEQKAKMTSYEQSPPSKDQQQPAAYYKSLSFKEMIETHKETKRGKIFKRKSSHRSFAVSVSFSSVLSKKSRLMSFKKWRINKMKNVSVDEKIGIVGWVASGDHKVGVENLENAKSKFGDYRIMRNASISMQKKAAVQLEEELEGSGSGFELCKRRILMGEKCMPLNISGTLHYDETGSLLAEEI